MNQFDRGIGIVGAAVALCALLAACSAFRDFKHGKADRGIAFDHAQHAREGIGCADCHEITAGLPAPTPGHNLCSICHTIADEKMADQSCNLCHTRPDQSIVARVAVLSGEIKFDHAVHNEAAVSCAECHSNPDRGALTTPRLKPLCMACHAAREHSGIELASVDENGAAGNAFRANECSVCHRTLNEDTVPSTRDGVRIAHDAPNVWKRVHGMESHVDRMFCAQCHDAEEHCDACHAIEKPQSHTTAWNRRIHGLQATWDRQRCAVCHEEDSCIKCHRTAQPASHRGAFDPPQNTHCIQCHFPPENNCAICHEAIDHVSAPPTPHDAGGGFPGDCSLCHPGGIGGASPHLTNLTVSCTFCHQ